MVSEYGISDGVAGADTARLPRRSRDCLPCAGPHPLRQGPDEVFARHINAKPMLSPPELKPVLKNIDYSQI
jgi:hypothetical protein